MLRQQMAVNPRQVQNASLPIEVTLAGIITDFNPSKWENAFSPMEVTLVGIIVVLQPDINLLELDSIMALQLSRLSYFVFFSSTLTSLKQKKESQIRMQRAVNLKKQKLQRL